MPSLLLLPHWLDLCDLWGSKRTPSQGTGSQVLGPNLLPACSKVWVLLSKPVPQLSHGAKDTCIDECFFIHSLIEQAGIDFYHVSGLCLGSGGTGLSEQTPQCTQLQGHPSPWTLRMSVPKQDTLAPCSPGTHMLLGG